MSITLGTQLGTSETILFTATAETAVLSVLFCNVTTNARTITLYAYPSGGTASDSNIIAIIPVGTYVPYAWSGDEKLLLDVGDIISAKADAASAISAKTCYKIIEE